MPKLIKSQKMSSKDSVVAEMTTPVPEKSIGDVPTTDLVSGDTELLGMR
jgi:hypothetical protein